MNIPDSYDVRLVRFLSAVLTPGGIALWPWLVVLGISQPHVGRWLLKSELLPFSVILIATIAVGLVVENFGSHLEDRLVKSAKINDDAWFLYLRSKPNATTGLAYISSIVTRLKFELSTIFALPVGTAALLVIIFAQKGFPWRPGVALANVAAALTYRLYRDTKDSVELLDKTRKQIFLT